MDIRQIDFFKTLSFKFICGFLFVIVPLTVLLSYNSIYAMDVVRNQVTHTYSDLVSLYMKQVDQNLSIADDYLYDIVVRETDLLLLESVQPAAESTAHLAKVRLLNRLTSDITNYRFLDSFFIYSKTTGDFLSSRTRTSNYSQEQQIQEALFKKISNPGSSGYSKWFTEEIGSTSYFVRIVRTGEVYVGAWLNVDYFTEPLEQIDKGRNGKTFLVSGNGGVIGAEGFISEHGIKWEGDSSNSVLESNAGRYLTIRHQSASGSFFIYSLIPENRVLESLPYFKNITFAISITSLILLPLLFLYYRRAFLLPIYRLVSAMKRAKEGELGVRIPAANVAREFQIMNANFNNMLAEIGELKINIYEEKLRNKNMELKHLQMQINPHFFLNALNTVYYFAQARNYEMIRELSLSLIQYFRYMFQSGVDFALLQDELKHTRNYLNIQKMRFSKNFTYSILEDEHFADCLLPPLLIQTFVENTIKHAVDLDRCTHLDVSVSPETDEESYSISIRDNGKGFEEQLLRMLNSDAEISGNSGEQIGIWNVRRRLRLAFDRKALISFNNHPDGGAEIRMVLPQLRRSNKGDAL